jgi:hypothetical protein
MLVCILGKTAHDDYLQIPAQGTSCSGGRLGSAWSHNCKAETARGGQSLVNCCENEVKVRYRTASFG